jgi:fructan beta-fructosidase
MAVYDEHDKKQWIAFYTSPDLKAWTLRSRIDGFYECPDLFELPIDGDPTKTRWVLYAADGKYVLGDFDGAAFTPAGGKHQLWHGDFYAAQTYDNAPNGRRVQVGWARGVAFPGRPFNQQMTVPCELTLRTTPDGVRMFAEPVPELASLRGKKHAVTGHGLKPGANPFADAAGTLFDIDAEFDPAGADAVGVTVRGTVVVYDAKKETVTCGKYTAPLPPTGGKVRLRVLADAGSVEVFANGGRVALSAAAIPKAGAPPVEVFARGGPANVSAVAWELRSAWAK